MKNSTLINFQGGNSKQEKMCEHIKYSLTFSLFQEQKIIQSLIIAFFLSVNGIGGAEI